MTDADDLFDLAVKLRDLLTSPGLQDLVQLDPSFPADYPETLERAIVAVAEFHGLREQIEISSDTARLLQQRETLARALDFYADPDTWFAVAVVGDPPCGDIVRDWSEHGSGDYPEGDVRPGRVAREALASIWPEP